MGSNFLLLSMLSLTWILAWVPCFPRPMPTTIWYNYISRYGFRTAMLCKFYLAHSSSCGKTFHSSQAIDRSSASLASRVSLYCDNQGQHIICFRVKQWILHGSNRRHDDTRGHDATTGFWWRRRIRNLANSQALKGRFFIIITTITDATS
jgi:hypothetical protein